MNRAMRQLPDGLIRFRQLRPRARRALPRAPRWAMSLNHVAAHRPMIAFVGALRRTEHVRSVPPHIEWLLPGPNTRAAEVQERAQSGQDRGQS